jgi:hypothetical protein
MMPPVYVIFALICDLTDFSCYSSDSIEFYLLHQSSTSLPFSSRFLRSAMSKTESIESSSLSLSLSLSLSVTNHVILGETM